MRAAHCPVRRDFVALDDFILHRAVKIGKCCSEHGDPLLEPRPAGGRTPAQVVADPLSCDQLIHDRQIALVEGFVEDLSDDGSALPG